MRKGKKMKKKNKHTNPSLKKNFLYNTLYQVLSLIVPIITTPYISRILGADGIGIYSYTSSIIAVFVLIASLGTQSYGAREIAQNRENKEKASKIFWEIIILNSLTFIGCFVLFLFIIVLNKEYRWYFLSLIPVLLATPLDISWFYNGYEKVKYVVIRNTICKVLGVVLLFLFVRDKEDLLIYFLINSMSTLFGNLSMWTYLPRMLVKVSIREMSIKKHFKETLVYFIPTIATSIYTILDKTLIGIITKDSYENGFYEQATKITNIIKVFVFLALNSVMSVRISYLFAKNKMDEIYNFIQQSLDIVLFLGYGAVFGIIGVAKNFVPVFLGEGYEPVVYLLYCMSPLILIVGISNCLGSQYYTPFGKRKFSAKIIVFGSIINFILNIVMIPIVGAFGATLASICAELVITILYLKYCQGYIKLKDLWQKSYKRLVAGSVMLIGIWGINYILNLGQLYKLIIQIMVGISIYGCILLLWHDSIIYQGLNIIQIKFAEKSKGKDKNG